MQEAERLEAALREGKLPSELAAAAAAAQEQQQQQQQQGGGGEQAMDEG